MIELLCHYCCCWWCGCRLSCSDAVVELGFFDGDDDGDDDGEDVVKEYGKTSAVGDDEDDADSKAGKADGQMRDR